MRAFVLLAYTVGVLACGDARSTPTAPSLLVSVDGTPEVAAEATSGGATSASVPAHILHPVSFELVQGLVAFPLRSEPNRFFQDLQALYRDTLRRPETVTFVDAEGQNVWLTEYFRFYLNGCSHEEATSRTLTEITTGSTLSTCGAETLAFPPRNLPNDFQNRLQSTYRDVLRRPATSTYVDSEGANVWLAQYLRFRVVGHCDHSAAESRVFTEIRGGGVQPDCGSTPTPSPTPPALNVSGRWDALFSGTVVERKDGGPVGGSQTDSFVLSLEQSGASLSGVVIFSEGHPSEFRIPITGTLTGTRLEYRADTNLGGCALSIRADTTVTATANGFSGTQTQSTCEGRAEGTVTASKR